MEEAGSGHEDSSHNIPTLDALQVLSRSQVTLSCQRPCGYGRYVKVYIHTYTLANVFPCGMRECVQVVFA
jgi:hypothetical protein